MTEAEDKTLQQGLARMKKPVLPLVNMVEYLYLNGPFKKIDEVLERLTEAVKLAGVYYDNPQQMLGEYRVLLQEFEVIKGQRKPAAGRPFIVDEKQKPLAKRQTLELWIKQQILSRELEAINSLLCGSCGCVLCCTGPNSVFDEASGFKGKMKQEFFEIPLKDSEIELFALRRIDTAESRTMTAHGDPPLQLGHLPFYKHDPALYHCENNWSLILPEGSLCPQLSATTKQCTIYASRPEVCRKPQIFAYVLEKTPDTAKRSDGVLIPVYMARNKILAVWDCPYVRRFQHEIGVYAEVAGLEPIFKKSKT